MAEMTARVLRLSERSSGRVGVIRIAVAMFYGEVQFPQFIVLVEKTTEDDNSLNGEESVGIGIVLFNPRKQSDQRLLRRLEPDSAGRRSTNQILSFVREGLHAPFGWINVALSLQLRG